MTTQVNKHITLNQHIRIIRYWLGSALILACASPAHSAELALADSPLFLGTQTDPNVFFMVDDSGSMDWEVLTIPHWSFSDYWTATGTNGMVQNGTFHSITNNPVPGNCDGEERPFHYIHADAINTDNNYTDDCDHPSFERHDQVSQNIDWRFRSAAINVQYYDPARTYHPWPGYPDADFTAARSNPHPGIAGHNLIRNLTGFKFSVGQDDHGFNGTSPQGPTSANDQPNGILDLWDSHRTYTLNARDMLVETVNVPPAGTGFTHGDCDTNEATQTPAYAQCFGSTATNSIVTADTPNPWGRTLSGEKQNIANWYQYARRRSFVVKGAIAQAVIAHPGVRFGYAQINNPEQSFVAMPDPQINDYARHNADLIATMAASETEAQNTPQRRGLEAAGKYYNNQYGAFANPIISKCQQHTTLLITDGPWNGDAPLTPAIGDADGDGATNTLADIAHHFYTRDLSPLEDAVPTTPIDPATHQHMVTFTVAYGVQGSLMDSDGDGHPNPPQATDDPWGRQGATINTNPEKIDDLWHAAFNSKGRFHSARTPSELAQAINDALQEISDRAGSATALATNAGSLETGGKLFQARFDSTDWKGQLLAYPINPDGTVQTTPAWEAGVRLNKQHFDTGREIITFNSAINAPAGGGAGSGVGSGMGSKVGSGVGSGVGSRVESRVEGRGIPFRAPLNYQHPAPTELTPAQLAHLMRNAPHDPATADPTEAAANQRYVADLINYLRGDRSRQASNSPQSAAVNNLNGNSSEGQGGRQFRPRKSILGDIVHSAPKLVATPKLRYADTLEAKPYSNFVTANATRQPVVYVGANDGMLHGFNADTGDEIIAYIPAAVHRNLAKLSNPDYLHRYFVDGSPNISDVFFANTPDPATATTGVWRTVLAGGLNAGGQAIYALDVTNPAQFIEDNAAAIVLWEFDDSDDPDLGYTFSKPQLAKLNDGSWAAVFGNGYNNTEADGHASDTGHAVLFIVDIETGDLIRKIDTQAGSPTTPNGLATPLLIDHNGDQIADFAYAGDLLGNLWKFNLQGPASHWQVAWSSAGKPAPLFTTQPNQPITTQPQATMHPDNLAGFLVFFGTGQYLEQADNSASGQATQSFYGIWDRNQPTPPNITTANLLQQTITNQYQQTIDTNNDGSDDQQSNLRDASDQTATQTQRDQQFNLRDVSDRPINWTTHSGWYLNLLPTRIDASPNLANFGERQVSDAIIRNGRLLFTTLIPSADECASGGTSFLMEIDLRDGGALEFPAFDLNGDGEADTDASGLAPSTGILPAVSLITTDTQDILFAPGISGEIETIAVSTGNHTHGRQSWRQLK